MTSRPWSVVAVWFVCFHLLFTSHNYHLLAILLWLHRAVPLSSRSAETTDGSHHGRPLQSDLHRHFHQSLQNFYHQAVKKLTISCLFLSPALNECLLNLKWWSVWIILLLLWTETLINAVKPADSRIPPPPQHHRMWRTKNYTTIHTQFTVNQ